MIAKNLNDDEFNEPQPKMRAMRMAGSINQASAMRRMFYFVIVPTLVAAFYYIFIAADIYVAESKFSVSVEGQNVSAGGLSILSPVLSNGANHYEAMVVKEYIESPAIIDRLSKRINLRAIFDNEHADFLSQISSSSNREEFHQEFQKKISIVFDDVSGIVTMDAKAFTPKDSQLLAAAILDEAEEFVNRMSDRMKADAIEFSVKELKTSEQDIINVNRELAKFRNTNGSFDPNITATGIISVTAALEAELANTEAQISNLRNYMQPNNVAITSLESKADSLRQQVQAQNEKLSGNEKGSFASMAEAYESLNLQKTFATKRYEIQTASYQAAQEEARKKSKYLLRIVEPTTPEEAVEPKKLKEILTVFVALLVAYMLVSLTIAAIRDHIRA